MFTWIGDQGLSIEASDSVSGMVNRCRPFQANDGEWARFPRTVAWSDEWMRRWRANGLGNPWQFEWPNFTEG